MAAAVPVLGLDSGNKRQASAQGNEAQHFPPPKTPAELRRKHGIVLSSRHFCVSVRFLKLPLP
jgi:hypothetical protein